MEIKKIKRQIVSKLDKQNDQYEINTSEMISKLNDIDQLLDEAELGGGSHHHERLAKKGKMSIRERIFNVLDPDTPFLEISPLAAYDSDYAIGGGCVAGIGVISGVECVIFGNDPTVLAGALTHYASKKWGRCIEIARDNGIPYISFVESAGADLRINPMSKEKPWNIGTGHFAETGRWFYEMTELSKMRIPTIAVVFGSSTAGGAYQPGMSDYNIFIKDQSKVFLAGPPLVKMATGEESDDETLGGAQMHSEVSGLSDYLAEDEMDALRICREVVSHLNWKKAESDPKAKSECPLYDSEELLGLVSPDLKTPFDIKEAIARFVDGSRFEEFKPLFGPTIVTGWAEVHGYPVGIVGNNGAIYPDSAQKAAHFIQLCNKTNTPIIFLQNVTGFLVGKEFERDGIVKKGSQMINAVSNSTVPHITIILGASYGAGTYAMSGRAFNNRFTFLWPSAKIAVMGGKQIAGVMSMVRRARAMRKGEDFDEKQDKLLADAVEKLQDQGSLAVEATGLISDDGIIDPRDTRTVLGICLSVAGNKPIEGTEEYGVFRL
ncbi:MAG: acetyl-CoA carboxylase carboxyltransferase subunit [Gammaproteobacteria bacterium]|nr:acetyl-CoA carboxylase carboxyltransferase subunit [Gammaproteobacteria bacterium]OUT92717.1 MAG: acetyl-CoA carboxylase carboxyltransferase subunit [Gammaproteobacteria bacterium TMED36]|tara:strand:+ start:2037 stop:3683 length:1647 start_codon:yes stop_codon:yes gene_type:complete